MELLGRTLGHWAVPYGPFFQFRGSIHHFELHSITMADYEVEDVVEVLVNGLDPGSASAPTGCSDCPAGFSDDDSDPSTPCAPCTAGRFSAATAVAGACPQTCPVGQSSSVEGATDGSGCEDCPAGTYALSGVCTPCAAGTFSTAAGASDANVCSACGRGTGSPAGATACATTGCTDEQATNFDVAAVVDSGLCQYTCDGLRATLSITVAGGCLIHDAASDAWGRYGADGQYQSDLLLGTVPNGEHWVVQGRPMAGSTPDQPVYPEYARPGGISLFNARVTLRYIDISRQSSETVERTYGSALAAKFNGNCEMEGGCWADLVRPTLLCSILPLTADGAGPRQH